MKHCLPPILAARSNPFSLAQLPAHFSIVRNVAARSPRFRRWPSGDDATGCARRSVGDQNRTVGRPTISAPCSRFVTPYDNCVRSRALFRWSIIGVAVLLVNLPTLLDVVTRNPVQLYAYVNPPWVIRSSPDRPSSTRMPATSRWPWAIWPHRTGFTGTFPGGTRTKVWDLRWRGRCRRPRSSRSSSSWKDLWDSSCSTSRWSSQPATPRFSSFGVWV